MAETPAPEGNAGRPQVARPAPAAGRWLWIAAALLAANSAYLAVAGGPGWLHLVNLLAHPLLGLLVAFVALIAWRRHRDPWLRGGVLLLLAAVGAGALAAMVDRSGVTAALVWSHGGLGLAGLACLVAAAARRSPGPSWKLAAAALAVLVLGVALFRSIGFRDEQGEGLFLNPPYTLSMAEAAQGGADGPFYPSPARLADGGFLPAAVAAEAEACGRCHGDVVEEWSASPHRFAGLDNPWYRRTFEAMVREQGAVPARWCAGCHTPALLLSGEADRPPAEAAEMPLARIGVSCTVCHGMTAIRGTTGQAGFELEVPPLHQMALTSNRWQRTLYDLYVRLDPDAHRAAYSRPLRDNAGSPEMCAACHAGYLVEEVNDSGVVPYFNDYYLWRVSSASGESISRSIVFPERQTCVECHMPRRATGTGLSHRFAAANTALPAWQGDQQQLDAVVDFLTGGEVGIELFAARAVAPDEQPAAPDQGIYAPLDRLRPALPRGREVLLDALVRNHSVGHGFPGGKLDLQDIWVEIEGLAEDGRTLFVSGTDGEFESAAHRYGRLWLDADSAPLEHHDLWDARALAWNRVIDPGDADLVRFRVRIPEDSGSALTLVVRVQHRAFQPQFQRWVFEPLDEDSPRLPIVTVAEDRLTLPVTDGGLAVPPDQTVPPPGPEDADRWRAYGLSLLLTADYSASIAAQRRALELAPDDAMARLLLAWAARNGADMPLAWETLREGLAREEQRLAAAGDDAAVSPELGRLRLSLGLMENMEGSRENALEHLRFAASHFPRDIGILRLLAIVHIEGSEFEAAVEQYRKILALSPLDEGAHFGLMRSLSGLKQPEQAAYHRRIFDALQRRQEETRVQSFFEAHPEEAADQRMNHEHRALPSPQAGTEER